MMAIIFLSTALLGLIFIIISMIASSMFMFGWKTVKVSGVNKLEVQIKGIEVHVETNHVFFAVLLGIMMVLVGGCGPKYFGDKGEGRRQDRAIQHTAKLTEDGYRISKEEIRIDLRKRKKISKLESSFGTALSETERFQRIVIKDIDTGIEEINLPHATSGTRIKCEDKPPDARWRILEDEAKILYHPFVELLKGRGLFKNLLAKGGRMQSYYMIAPVTNGKGQEVVYTLKYYNAFQGRDFEWVGKCLSADTDTITMHIIFPEDKPFKSFETYRKENRAAPKILIDDPEVEITSEHRALKWKIQNAKKGEMYLIKWLW